MTEMTRSAAMLAFVVLLTCGLRAQTAQQPAASKLTTPEPGELTGGAYRNPSFGFTYKLPYGWVDRTAEMHEASTDPAKSMVLRGVVDRPPEANGEGVNSGVIIAAESAASYPGLKDAAQYFGPLGEVTTAKGLTATDEAYEFPVDGKPIVRRDFVKKFGGGTSMHQSTLAWLARGYVVSFTFIGSSDEDVLRLVEGLTFVRKAAHR
jgi:hypothetical protein